MLSESGVFVLHELGLGVETGAVGNDPIPAIRVKPGEFFLAAEAVQRGLRFDAGGDLYEVVGEPARVGPGWLARVRKVGGPGPGGEHNALLHTGERVNR